MSACLAAAAAPDCGPEARGVALQVLGSGGPVADDGRASAGYLVWVDGRARALIDAGGGVFQRFGASGARLADLDLIALSHLHTDHSADLPALMKSAYFSDRRQALPVIGPSGEGSFPDLAAFVAALFGADGAYRYLGGVMNGTDGLPLLAPHTVDHTSRVPVSVGLPAAATLAVSAVGVHHGIVPALAFRVDIAGRRIFFAGDQSGRNPHVAAAARGADLLVVHAAIPADAGPGARSLHRTPAELAAFVAAARPKRVLVGHWMQRSLAERDGIMQEIEEAAPGRTVAAEDLLCVAVP